MERNDPKFMGRGSFRRSARRVRSSLPSYDVTSNEVTFGQVVFRPMATAKNDSISPAERAGEATLTVEQLAYETGMSVRNIRNHQSRGLLPPPEVRARTGYYGPQHVARLRLIQEMQAEGFKLSAISRLIGEHGADADRFVGLRQAVSAPFATEAPEVLTRAELTERFGVADDKLLGKAQKLGLLIDLGDE